ncbi:hypothetical protein PQR21_33300 [Paraburkholderia nemoris]|uniref:hypothetical protein n=1 Tax=Paraburkholderia nemoris TaxID=2793076 RepID=UPI0038B8D5FA
MNVIMTGSLGGMGFPTLSLLERETLTHIRQSPGRSDNVDHANRTNTLEAENRFHSIERRFPFAVSPGAISRGETAGDAVRRK